MARPKREFVFLAGEHGLTVGGTFNVGVFGIPAKLVNGEVHIKVNVRTDQARQRELAKIDPTLTVLLVDCPGGAVSSEDKGIDDAAVAREIYEETLGCTITPKGEFRSPLVLLPKDGKPGDLAFWKPVVLHGEPKPSNEAMDHPWVTRAELEAATKYRAVSGLGLAGRTGKMMLAALDFYETNKDKPEFFS